jgi:hypothetical protein
MKDSYTLDDLIFYAYCETEDLGETRLFDNSKAEEKFRNEFKSMFLDSKKVSPDRRLIDNIMSYARALCVIKTERAGVLNFIMN